MTSCPGERVLQKPDVAALVRAELEQVNAELAEDLRPAHPELAPLVRHVGQYRGKQLRPTLVLLAGKATGELGPAHITVAKVVELIHTATLVHDDILDSATLRRQLPTVNAMCGNEVPVLLGDYIYARAFHLSVSMSDQTCSRLLSEVTRTICQGEIMQILHRFDFGWSEARYFEVIGAKTASLYGAACRLGAHYAGANEAQVTACERFGMELGIAFQIVDDCLDLGGDERIVGKTLGSDLDKGKLTLPLLYYLNGDAEGNGDSATLRQLLEATPPGARLRRLRAELDLARGIDYAMGHAGERVNRALAELRRLPDSPARDAMAGLAEFVVARNL